MVLSELRVAILLHFKRSAVFGLYLWGFTLPKESHALVLHAGNSTVAVQRLGYCSLLRSVYSTQYIKIILSAVKAGSTFFSGSKLVRAWCFGTILITNCYIFGCNKV